VKSQNSTLLAENHTIKSKLGGFQKERQNFSEEIAKIKKSYETQIGFYAEDYNSKIKELEDKIEETSRKEKSTREKTMEVLRTHEKIEEKLRKELETYVKYYEKMISELKSENKQLSYKMREIKA